MSSANTNTSAREGGSLRRGFSLLVADKQWNTEISNAVSKWSISTVSTAEAPARQESIVTLVTRMPGDSDSDDSVNDSVQALGIAQTAAVSSFHGDSPENRANRYFDDYTRATGPIKDAFLPILFHDLLDNEEEIAREKGKSITHHHRRLARAVRRFDRIRQIADKQDASGGSLKVTVTFNPEVATKLGIQATRQGEASGASTEH